MKKRASSDPFQGGTQGAKKLVASIVIVGVFVFYSLLHARPDLAAGNAPGSASGTSTPSSDATAIPGALFKDGSYTGSVADAQWGYVQVKAVIQGGKIADVPFLQYPNDRSRSININAYADPALTSEAIQAQSAQVDIVTGATDTSEAFMQSLADALARARA